MLQSLELANGASLDTLVRAGAALLAKTVAPGPSDPADAMRSLCWKAYSRDATAQEIELARDLLKSQQSEDERREGWEDLLWIVVMAPEFQYVN